MDFTSERGPIVCGLQRPRPATFGRTRPLLELPCTTGFIGARARIGGRAAASRGVGRAGCSPSRAVGILARTGVLNKVMLSPEGNTLEEMQALTRALHADGLRTFALTFHSPSLKPGCTRYVPAAAEREDVSCDDRSVL